MEQRGLPLPSAAHTCCSLLDEVPKHHKYPNQVDKELWAKLNSKTTSSICFNYLTFHTCNSLMQVHKSSCVQQLGIQWFLLLNFHTSASK